MGKTAIKAVLEVGEQAEAAAEEVFKEQTAEADVNKALFYFVVVNRCPIE